LDQSHRHLKHWEIHLEFQMPLSPAETNRALLSINFHLQSAPLRVASSDTQNMEIEGGSDVERAENVWMELQFSNDPVKPILIVSMCVCCVSGPLSPRHGASSDCG